MRILLIPLLIIPTVLGWDVLIANVLASGSHQPVTKYLANLLAKNGHVVTYLSICIPKNLHPAITTLPMPKAQEVGYTIMEDTANGRNKEQLSTWGGRFQMFDALLSGCQRFYDEPNVQDLMKTKKKYDLLVTFVAFYDPCVLSLAHHLNIENVILHSPSNVLFPNHIPLLGLPFYASSQKLEGFVLTEPRDIRTSALARFKQLLLNGAARMLQSLAVKYYIDPAIYQHVPDYPGHIAAYDKVKMIFMHAHFHPMIDHPFPLGPGIVNLGGTLCSEYKPKQLAPDLLEFIESKDTFIFVSFGSVLQALPVHEERLLMETFTKLPFNVVWKVSNLDLDRPDLPRNVKLVTWVPQMTLLQHPNIKLFVTHGGHGSKMESFCSGLPFLVIPRFALDQFINAERYKHMGISDNILTLKNISSGEIKLKIINMLDEKYAKKYREIKRQFLSTKLTDEQVLGYIDMAISGYKLLPGFQPFWEYFYLDIILLPILVIVGIRYLVKKIRICLK